MDISPQVKAIKENANNMANLIKGDLITIANDLNLAKLLSEEGYDVIVNTPGISPLQRANILIQRVIPQVEVDPAQYEVFCGVLEKHLNPEVVRKILPKLDGSDRAAILQFVRNACRPHFDHGRMVAFGHYLGIEPSYVTQMVDIHRDDHQQFLVEVIHHWLQKHPEPNWRELEIAMYRVLRAHPLDYPPHQAVHHALETLRKEYEDLPSKSPPLPAEPKIGSLEGVKVIAVSEFTVSAQVTDFEWEGYGLRLHVPEGSLPGGMEKCMVNIKASLSGKFQLPEDTILLSPVFWISVPCKSTKPVTLEIQHCALREDEKVLSGLSFVSAEDSHKNLPYRFKQLDGGVFTMRSAYGTIQLRHFCGIGIIGRMCTPRSYCVHVYHAMERLNKWIYYLAITQDHPIQNNAVKKEFSSTAKFQTSSLVEFQENEITLGIPDREKLNQEGWKITEVSSPAIIARTDADKFHYEGQCIPRCELMVEWKREGKAQAPLQLNIILNGARRPRNLNLVLDPEGALAASACSTTANIFSMKPTLTQLTIMKTIRGEKIKIIESVAPQWKKLGDLLDFDPEGRTLELIAANNQLNDVVACCREMFVTWLKGNGREATWEVLIELLDDNDQSELAKKIKTALQ